MTPPTEAEQATCGRCGVAASVRFFEPDGAVHSTMCASHARAMFSGWCCGMGCENCKLDPLLGLTATVLGEW